MTTRRRSPQRAPQRRESYRLPEAAERFMAGARVVYRHQNQRRVVTVVKLLGDEYEAVWEGAVMGRVRPEEDRPSQLVYFKPSAIEEVMYFGDLRPGALVAVQPTRGDEVFVRVADVDTDAGTFEGIIVPPDGSVAGRALSLLVGRLDRFEGDLHEVLEVVNHTDAAEFVP